MSKQVDASVPVVFVDTEYRRRVVVFPDGSFIPVLAGKAEVTAPEHVAYLESSPSFTRISAKEH
ncbi:hypothetical protein DX980_01455 [Burkholderia gladioli]|uniref:hypothetical protein n=1 Tax=Burkholderia gladioli TaxID=28095 RepID=UPI001364DC69|nr:hypothetical protein [Burkholderia gladioli]KAF1061642.1 hypothetical protein LvStA_00255 [Burkholderia gladioli]WAG18027.1 hypothetical protein DX980_01455 [Burkholderia gladioli]